MMGKLFKNLLPLLLAGLTGYVAGSGTLPEGWEQAWQTGRKIYRSAHETVSGLYQGAADTQTPNRQTAYNGRVSRVHDGDTLHVIDSNGIKHKIRMAYIDAPEITQDYGRLSRDNLSMAAQGRQVSVKVFDTDRYKREVAQVSIGGRDLNLMQLQDGAAWHYVSYAKKAQNKKAFAAYAAAQSEAKQNRRGLWRAETPLQPWVYRSRERGRQNGGSD